MSSVLTHPAPALCLGYVLGGSVVSTHLLLAGVLCTLLPDLDVAGFNFGIKYADALGHRGLSHSLLFALTIGALAWLAAPLLRARRGLAFLFCGGAVLSHIALDALTNGGLGVAVLWPFSDQRYFFPWRPIVVSPFSISRFFSDWGKRVLISEFLWVWLPCLTLMATAWLARRPLRGANKKR